MLHAADNYLFNGVCQLRWQHLLPVVSTFSTSIRLLTSFFIKHCILPLLEYPSCFHNLWSFPAVWRCWCSKFFAVRHILYPMNSSNYHFHTGAVVPSSDHCRTEAVLPPSDHYCIETVAPSGDHYCIDIYSSAI